MGDDRVYLNGSLVPRNEARVSALDRGFLYGDGFFETTRVVAGRALLLGRHVDRLNRSCRHAGWERDVDGREIARAVAELVACNGVGEGYLRITASRGPYEGRLTELVASKPTLLIQVRAMQLPPVGAPPPLVLARSPHRRNEHSALVAHKSLSYQENLLALARARERGAGEVYFLNTRGRLAEGAITNLFFVRSKTVCTPAVECGLLPGVTRQVVLELCDAEGMPHEEGQYGEKELASADEVFCTNSLRGIVPVSAILEYPEKTFPNRPMTSALQRAYAELVRRECEGA